MLRTYHSRRKPDFLLILLSLVGLALLATVTIHYHLLDHTRSVDPGHSYSEQRL
ncbi:MAG: hypothetical protein OQL20_11470 [Sedimenticola sp.]|nr:hypothetical protein [Sedimenticola sp.]